MKLLPAFIPEELIKVIGWTILHSLWQGILLALVLALLLGILHRRSAAIRYIVSAVAMLIFLLFTVSTFISQYKSFFYAAGTPVASTLPTVNATGFPVDLVTGPTRDAVQHGWIFSPDFPFIAYFNQHIPLVVLVWLMGISVLLLRFIGGLTYIQRLKSYKNTPLPAIWQNRLQVLAQKLQMNQSVRLVESALVKVPMVIGYFKPVILLPLGAVTGLPVQQMEAILAHELAHIYRKDYLINLVQSLMEIIFFYHPCIWWMSSRMREEREHCCDDIALSICADSLTFAKALTNLQTINGTPHHLAIAITGKRNYLHYRIKRLLNGPKKDPNFGEGFVAALFLMLSLLAVSVSAGSPFYRSNETMTDLLSNTSYNLVDQNTENNQVAPKLLYAGDSIKAKGKRTISFNGIRNNRNYDVKIIMDADTITELYIDGKRIPSGKIMEYRDLIDDLTSDLVAPLEPFEPFGPIEIAAEVEPIEPPEEMEPMLPVVPIEVDEPEPVEPPEPIEPVGFGYTEFWRDTTRVKGKTTITFNGMKDGKKLNYKIRMEDGLVKELFVDGKKIPDDKIPQYSDLIEEYTRNSDERQAEAMLRQEKLRRQHEEIRREQNENRERMLLEREQLRREREIEHEKMREDLNIRRQSVMKEREKLMRERATAMAKRDEIHKERDALINLLQEELEEDKLIQNKNKFEFKLNANGLYVDGVEQPAAVFEKYKKLVEKHNGKNSKNFDMEIKINRNED